MTATLAPAPRPRRRNARRHAGAASHARTAGATSTSSGDAHRLLGQYTERDERIREVIARPGAAASTLVVDRDRRTLGDERLVAHLAADEPPENAALVCERYLQDLAAGECRCRALCEEDARIDPLADQRRADLESLPASGAVAPLDRLGNRYTLELLAGGMSIPELRWCRRRPGGPADIAAVSMRDAVASLESYEPVCALTLRALSLHGRSRAVSTTILRAELARVRESPIVLNRRLREAVLAAVERSELSMSEIAIRCGRVKRDRRGGESGETSWLARRLGILPEGGQSTPTPWIHSDVLALIAREGLGLSPREVEL
jgi:hypothetical protein